MVHMLLLADSSVSFKSVGRNSVQYLNEQSPGHSNIPLTIPDTLVMHPIRHVAIHLSTLQRTTKTPHSDVLENGE